MAYLGTSALAKMLKIPRSTLYGLIRGGVISAPVKARGRFLWSEGDIAVVKVALSAPKQWNSGFSPVDKRYYGSKTKWGPFLRSVVEEYAPQFSSFADFFAGAGGVAATFADKVLIVNDLSDSAAVFLKAWFLPEPVDERKVSDIIKKYNALPTGGENYVSKNFGGNYFEWDTAGKIGRIREDIAEKRRQKFVNAREEAALIASLLYAMDDAANIYAHYDTFKKPPEKWAKLRLLPPKLGSSQTANRVFQTDANMLVPFVYADVAYLDPPANSRQYCDIYHLPDNIARWEKPPVQGIARKPLRGYKKSLYCKKGAKEVYANLIRDVNAGLILASLPGKHLGREKRSEAKFEPADVISALSKRGEVRVVYPSLPKKKVADGAQLLLPYEFLSGKGGAEGWKDYTEGGVAVCIPGVFGKSIVDSPINFIGGKFRLLEQILPYFPKNISRVFDVFAGGCSVGLNTGVQSTVFIDADEAVMGLFSAIRKFPQADFLAAVLKVIGESGLSLTFCHSYKFYGVTGEEGLAEVNHAAYGALRDRFNALAERDIYYWAILYVLIVYGYNNMPRFNAAGRFNLPVGKRDFNASMARKLAEFTRRVQSLDVRFVAADFRSIDMGGIGPADFVFLDPPFMGAGAYYNARGWRSTDERDLLALLSRWDMRGVRYALFTVLSYGDAKDDVLSNWLSRSPHRVVRIASENAGTALILNY